MYDLDCVDDQHSNGKSVGKYHMVIRVKVADQENAATISICSMNLRRLVLQRPFSITATDSAKIISQSRWRYCRGQSRIHIERSIAPTNDPLES